MAPIPSPAPPCLGCSEVAGDCITDPIPVNGVGQVRKGGWKLLILGLWEGSEVGVSRGGRRQFPSHVP